MVGPIAGLVIIGAIVFVLMRRGKNKPQFNVPTAPMIETVGPGDGQPLAQQFTDAKPTLPQNSSYVQPLPGFDTNDPCNQQGFQQALFSPDPQYQLPYSHCQRLTPTVAVEIGDSSILAAELSGEHEQKPTQK